MLGLSYIFELSMQHYLALSFCVFSTGLFLLGSSAVLEKIKFGLLLSLQGLFLLSSTFLSFTMSFVFLIPLLATFLLMIKIFFDSNRDIEICSKELSFFRFESTEVLLFLLFFLIAELLF